MYAVTSYTIATVIWYVAGCIYSSLFSRVDVWIMAATCYCNSKMQHTNYTTEYAAELLENLNQDKLAPVHPLNTGLATLYGCNLILYELTIGRYVILTT